MSHRDAKPRQGRKKIGTVVPVGERLLLRPCRGYARKMRFPDGSRRGLTSYAPAGAVQTPSYTCAFPTAYAVG